MIVGTYQPSDEHYNPDYGKGGKRQPLEDKFGDEIIWVIPVESVEELFVGSCLTVAECPEVFMLLDVRDDSCFGINKNEWEQYLDNTLPFEKVNIIPAPATDVNDRYNYDFFVKRGGLLTGIYTSDLNAKATFLFENIYNKDEQMVCKQYINSINENILRNPQNAGNKSLEDYKNGSMAFLYKDMYISSGLLLVDYLNLKGAGNLVKRSLPLSFMENFRLNYYLDYNFNPTDESLENMINYLKSELSTFGGLK